VIYQDPLAYLLGLEGIALLDAWAGDHDREFTETRLAEIRRLLDDEKLRDRGVLTERASTVTAYGPESASYDAKAGGGLFAADEPVVARVSRRPGAWRGARRRLRDRSFRRVPSPARASGHRRRQFSGHARSRAAACPGRRVPRRRARPAAAAGWLGGRHRLRARPRPRAPAPAGDGRVRHIAPTYRHQLGDYLRAALSLGLQVRRCEEPTSIGTGAPLPVPAAEIGDWQYWPWSLMNYLPSAARAAGGCPSLVVWHFQLPGA
jgi:hypothetical protein